MEEAINIKHKNKNEKLTMDQIPNHSLKEVASFLNYRNYLRFRRANRTVYIALSAPCKIHTFPAFKFIRTPASFHRLKQFRLSKHVRFKLNDIKFLLMPFGKKDMIWKDLQKLTVDISGDCWDYEMNAFIESDLCNLEKVKEIEICWSEYEHLDLGSEPVIKLLRSAPNVESVYIDCMEYSSRNITIDAVECICLKHLQICGYDLEILRFVKTESLKSLICRGGILEHLGTNQLLTKIEELKLKEPSDNDLRILAQKRTENLKRLYIAFADNRITPGLCNIFDTPSLEYIEVIDDDFQQSFYANGLDLLHKSILKYRNERKKVHIQLECHVYPPVRSLCLSKLAIFISSLHKWYRNRFVLKFVSLSLDSFKKHDIENIVDYRKNDFVVNGNCNRFHITGKECDISQFQEKWQYQSDRTSTV